LEANNDFSAFLQKVKEFMDTGLSSWKVLLSISMPFDALDI